MYNGDATPGKTEVSFKQWYHEVQCVKDHNPESMVWESSHGYGPIYGSYCQFCPYFMEAISLFWHGSKATVTRSPLLPQGWKGPSPNQITMSLGEG